MQTHGILCEEQYGFQTGKSCDSQLIVTTNDFVNCLNKNKRADDIFSISLKHSIKYLTKDCLTNSHYGIRGSTLVWIQNYLANRHQNVILEGISSTNSLVTSDVPQGIMLAPLLFLCFVNDILASVQCKIRLYADDILLYSEISSTNDCIRLQNDINYLFNWSETWLLQFNLDKCMHLQISKNAHVLNLHITWTDLSLKKCLLPVILVLLLIWGSLGQIMLQGLSPKQIQLWAFFNTT